MLLRLITPIFVGDGSTFGCICLLAFTLTFDSGALHIEHGEVHGRTFLETSHLHMQALVPATEYEPIENEATLSFRGGCLPDLIQLAAL